MLFAAFFLIGNQAISQKLVIENDKMSYSDQFRTSIKVTIEPNKKEVRTSWENWLEGKYDTKVDGTSWFNKKDVISAKRISIPFISDKQFDLYVKVVDKGQGSQLNIFASFGYDMHITPETFPKEYQALEILTLDYLTDFLTTYYSDRAENLEEIVRDLENNKNNLQEDISDNKKDIVNLKEENIGLENEMTSKGTELDEAAMKLEEVKESLDDVNKNLNVEKESNSQKLVIENDKISYSDQFRTSIKVTIEPNKREVRTSWENWLEGKYDTKVDGTSWFNKKDVISAKAISIPFISDKQFDLYAKVVDKGQGSQLNIFASFGYDMHITPETFPREYRALENLTLDYLTDFLTSYYSDRAENMEEIVRDLENNKNNLQEDISDNKKDIVELKEENIDLANRITSKGIELDEAAMKLEEIREKLDAVNKKLAVEKISNGNKKADNE